VGGRGRGGLAVMSFVLLPVGSCIMAIQGIPLQIVGRPPTPEEASKWQVASLEE